MKGSPPVGCLLLRVPAMARAGFALLLSGTRPALASTPSPAKDGGVQAVFATQQEAEAAAPRFGCTGSHSHGKIWMPCTSHPPTPSSGKSGGHSH
jgi:hypothetical protein